MRYSFVEDFLQVGSTEIRSKTKKATACGNRVSMQSCDREDDWVTTAAIGNYRPRRAHRKSRKGCADCKRRRIKCDERTPRCRRCTKLDQPCIYPNMGLLAPSDDNNESGHSPNSTASRDTSLSLPMNLLGSSSPECSSVSTPAMAHLNLSQEDSDLFIHFLQHTSHISGLEPESQYAWRLGIPTLAIKSPTLMHSVLAIGAMCLCMDIISTESQLDPELTSRDDFERVAHLAGVAISHHEQSVYEIGAAIIEPGLSADLDIVLVNAAIMVPYGFMLRRLKGWISERMLDSKSGIATLEAPETSWIYLCRMVKTAILGLRDHPRSSTKTKSRQGCGDSFKSLLGYIDLRASFSPISHVLYPIISATASTAVDKLQNRIFCMMSPVDSPSAAACLDAFGALKQTVDYVVMAAETTSPECTAVCHRFPTLGHLSDASPWVLAWLMSHPHLRASPHRGLEKIILAFLNSVSDDFLDLLIPVMDGGYTSNICSSMSSPDESTDAKLYLATEQIIAAEIFAHWLALLMLLETTWWVRDFGSLELTKLLLTLKSHHALGGLTFTPLDQYGSPEPTDSWWPEMVLQLKSRL